MNWEAWYKSLTPGEKVNHLFHMCEHRHRRMVDNNMARADISATQHRILAMLNHREVMSQKEIATAMGVTTSTMATTLKKMEADGLVERTMDKTDNRVNNIISTKKGKDVMELGFSIMTEIDKDSVEGFTEEELIMFTGLLEKYQKHLETIMDVDYFKKVDRKKED